MRTIIAALFAVLLLVGFTTDSHDAPPTEVVTWNVDKSHSSIGFKVRHLGITNVNGEFHDYDVSLKFDPADLSTLETTATIQIASIDTDNERRDNHLRSDDFFAAEEHPTMTFVSKEVRNVDGNEFELVGDLTIRGVTKEVVLDAELVGTAMMRGNAVAALEAETTINRFDYGLHWDRVTEAGGLIAGEDVRIILELEVQQAKS